MGLYLSDNQVTVACATLGKLCQISLLPLTKNKKQHIMRDQYNQPSEPHFDDPKNACTIRDNIGGSGGGIQVLIGLNLNYKDKGASLSVWRPTITTEEDGRKYFDCVRTVYQVRIHSFLYIAFI
jgi:hypothetical protein